MVTKATRDVIDLQTRPIIGGLLVEGDGTVNFSINGTRIGEVLPDTAIFSQATIATGGDLVINGGEINVNGSVKGIKGSAVSPGFAFGGGTGDPSAIASGLYAVGSGDTVTQVAISVNGVQHATFSTTQAQIPNGFPLRVSNGSPTVPSISPGDDTNTGIYWGSGNTNDTRFTNSGVNTWIFSAGGDILLGDGVAGGSANIGATGKRVGTIFADTVDAVNLSTSGVGQFEINGGSVASPGLTFTGDTDTGIFSPTANTLAVSVGGSESARFNAAGQLSLNSGTSNSPSIVGEDNTLRGIYFKTVDSIGFATSSSDFLVSSPTQLRIPNGSAGVPSLSSLTDIDTGVFFSGAGTIEFSINADRKWRINNNGHLIPKPGININNGSLDIGSSSERVRTLFAESINTPSFGGADLAEGFYNTGNTDLTEGDVVIVSGVDQGCKKSFKSCDTNVIGVVSDTAVFLMNYDKDDPNCVPIAMAGVVNVKYEGNIKPGDQLVSSKLPGHARKAKWWELILKPQAVLGKALISSSGASKVKIKIT